MPNTPKGLTYPSSSSPVAVAADIQELATDVDGLIVPNTGGTYTGAVSFTQSPSVPTPTSGLHAVNKTYADAINTDVTAIETELGTNPSGTFSTVVQRLDSYTDGFNKVGNLLTANQASVETDSSPFGAFLNCTISRSTAHSVHGSACLKAVATADGPFIAGLGESFPVVPGETITATFALKADREIVGVRVTIQWATGGSPGAVVYRTVTATTSWVTHSLTVVVPSGVETAGLFSWVTIHAAAGSEIYMDCFGVWKGAGGQWAMPGTPIVGQSSIAINNAVHLSGTGSPESVISAAPGSTYLQTDSVVDVKGWIRWVKSTGTGNTGWQVGPEADTGWRKCVVTDTAIFANGTYNAANPNSVFYLRRVGGLVSVKFSTGTSPTFTTEGQSIVLIPTGWRPALDGSTTATLGPDMPLFDAASGALVTKTLAWSSGENTQMRNFNAWASGGRYRGSVSWSTSDAWPSSLPATGYP